MPPVRIIHMGLGAFHRSHLAWYTAHAGDSEQWGIAAYTGRSAGLADDLTAQDGLYTLVVRSPAGDEAERIGSIVRAHPGTDIPSFLNDVAAPETVIVSVTITEAAYAEDQTSLDRTLLADAVGDDLATARPVTAIGRLVLGLEARRRAGSGAIAWSPATTCPTTGECSDVRSARSRPGWRDSSAGSMRTCPSCRARWTGSPLGSQTRRRPSSRNGTGTAHPSWQSRTPIGSSPGSFPQAARGGKWQGPASPTTSNRGRRESSGC